MFPSGGRGVSHQEFLLQIPPSVYDNGPSSVTHSRGNGILYLNHCGIGPCKCRRPQGEIVFIYTTQHCIFSAFSIFTLCRNSFFRRDMCMLSQSQHRLFKCCRSYGRAPVLLKINKRCLQEWYIQTMEYVLVKDIQINRTTNRTQMIYYNELPHTTIMEAENFQALQWAGWRPRELMVQLR